MLYIADADAVAYLHDPRFFSIDGLGVCVRARARVHVCVRVVVYV